MKKTKISWKSVAVGAGAVILLSAGIASAKSQSSLSMSLQALKDELSQLKEMKSLLDSFFAPVEPAKVLVKAPPKYGSPLQDLNFGATYANPSIAETSMVESSSSPCPLQNTDGVDRIIDRVKIFFNPDDPAVGYVGSNSTGTQQIGGQTFGANTWDVSTSSNSGTTSTASIQLFSAVNFTSNTRQMVFVSSTFAGQNDNLMYTNTGAFLTAASSTFNNGMQWKNNEWLVLKFSQPTSSTGFCAVQYHNK